MAVTAFIEDLLEESKRRLYRMLRDLTPEELIWRPVPEANSIGFIVWHIARVEDRWLAGFAVDQMTERWIRDGWAERCGLSESHTGVGFTLEQVDDFNKNMPPIAEIMAYFDAVREDMLAYLRSLNDADLDVVPGRAPFPEVGTLPPDFTIGRMFRQLIGEYNQHLGQVGYFTFHRI
ncbi:DinB family protein [Candidatus Entotheonella palauensis]|nr:DinB family protein [Candidatus Entotheonella palauensis]